jgi:hypothetical protein
MTTASRGAALVVIVQIVPVSGPRVPIDRTSRRYSRGERPSVRLNAVSVSYPSDLAIIETGQARCQRSDAPPVPLRVGDRWCALAEIDATSGDVAKYRREMVLDHLAGSGLSVRGKNGAGRRLTNGMAA